MTYIYLLGTYFLVKFFISIFRCFYYILLGGGMGERTCYSTLWRSSNNLQE